MPWPTDPEESGQIKRTCSSKRKEKRQQYIKCFFFNETNPKDVQSGSSCAVHKHGENKQTKRQFRTVAANPGQGWTCHQGGFFGTALGPAPLGWAPGQRAPACPHSAPGQPASLCPHFLGKQNEIQASNYCLVWRWNWYFSFENGSKHNRNIKKKTVTNQVLTTQTYPLFMVCHYLSPGLYLCMFSRLHKYMKTWIF